MIRNFFSLTEDPFARLEPLLPTDTRGKPRVDDRRVILGIVHVLKSGGPSLMARAKRLTIVSSAGRRKTCGSTSSMRSPRRADLRANSDR
jgi:hypothetical protein